MKRTKGFTLIELLAVIIILAIIAVITAATMLNVVSNARKESFKSGAYGFIDAAEMYYMKMDVNTPALPLVVNFTTNSNVSSLKYQGDKRDGGELKLDKDGQVQIAIWNENLKACVVKDYKDGEVRFNDNIKSKTDCMIANINK